MTPTADEACGSLLAERRHSCGVCQHFAWSGRMLMRQEPRSGLSMHALIIRPIGGCLEYVVAWHVLRH